MVIGRPRTFDPEQAINAAMAVFWEKGYEFTSLPDLLDAMALSKSSFYQTFASKDALFSRCIDHYCESLSSEMLGQLERSPSARQFIEALFLGVASAAGTPSSRLGCLLMNSVTEFGQREGEMTTRLQTGIGRFRQVFLAAVRRAQKEGDISPELDATALSHYLVSSLTGLKTLLKSGLSARQARQVATLVLQVLK